MMRRNGNRAFVVILSAAFWLSVFSTAALTANPPPPEKPIPAAIQELIKQLTSSDESTYKAAAAKLEQLPDAIPALRKAEASTDLTLAWRAEPVLREALYRKHRHMVEGYPIDVFLERLLRVEDSFEEEAYWRVATEFAGRIVDLEKQNFKTGFESFEGMPVYDFGKYRKKYPTIPIIGPRQPLPEKEGAVCIVRGETLHFTESVKRTNSFSLLTSPGSVRVNKLMSSVILSGDTVTARDCGQRSIVVADGDMVCRQGIRAAIVIARGSVKCRSGIEYSFVLAGGTVEQRKDPPPRASKVLERDPKFLGWVRFFETTDAGIEVTAATGGVAVAKLGDGLPLAKAGLKVGDMITAVDGKAAENPETFRRLLRRGTVLDQTKFTVKRDGKEVTVTASFLGWEPPALKLAK